MNINLKIEGMTCGHCMAGVKKALEAVPGVENAEVNLQEGWASVRHTGTVTPQSLLEAVVEEGYEAQAA